MELAKKQDEKLELVHVAICQLLEERKHREKDIEEEEEDLLLSRLLYQLESLQKDVSNTQLPSDAPNKEEPASSSSSKNKDFDIKVEMDEVVRELRRVKRQNFITHCLLSAMIIITAFWQFNEISLLLAVKEKFSHPIRAVGDMIKEFFKGRIKKPHVEAPPLPPVSVPEITHADLPSINLNSNLLSTLNHY